MKRLKTLILVFSIISLMSCTTSKSVVSKTADIRKYEYVTITDVMGYNGSPSLMDAEIHIYNALEMSGLKVIGDREIGQLSPRQQEKLLLAHFSVVQNETESIVSVNFVDYATGRPIASCRGAYGMGWNEEGDIRGAFKKLAAEIKNTFKK